MPSSWPSRSPGDGDAILIAAQSGRALAAAARRAGLRPYVVDLFGDSDTLELAEDYRQAPGRFGLGVGKDAILSLLDDLAGQAGTVRGIILGSGFEADPDLIAAIAARHPLLGCPAETVRAVKDPAHLAAVLHDLAVPHPAVRFEPPPDPRNWLVKRCGGSGGGHIRPAIETRPGEGFYWQRRVTGTPFSVAFLANGRDLTMVATTRQWTAPSRHAPFRYGGAVEPGGVPERVRDAVTRALGALTAATSLRGLASADCLVEGEEWWLLEINPRPGATLDILDRRATPLLQAHLEACRGHLPHLERPAGAAASEILYMSRTVPVVPDIDWPDHVMDRPQPGSRVDAGAPMCTVIAHGDTADEALSRLRARTKHVRSAFLHEDPDHVALAQPPERERTRRPARGGPRL